MDISKIILPTRGQTDTLVAVFLLKKLGGKYFPNIEHASIEVWNSIPENETDVSLAQKGILLLDIGGGALDHHNKEQKTTATRLVAELLEIESEPELQKLLQFTERDDFYGKGIVSEDPIDRAFGLPGLMANMNKDFPNDVSLVLERFLPLIESHYNEEVRRTKELPKELETRLQDGTAEVFSVRQKDKSLRVIIIESDNTSIVGFLRSQLGGRHDVVANIRSTGHISVLTRPTKRPDLRSLAMLVRLEEASKRGYTFDTDEEYLMKPGKIPEVPEWYYDTATNSLQNGGANTKNVEPTRITKEELRDLLSLGLIRVPRN